MTNPLISRLRDPTVIGNEELREEAVLEIQLLQNRVSRLLNRATRLTPSTNEHGECTHCGRLVTRT